MDDPPSPLASIEVSGEGNAGEDGVAEGFHVREEDLRRAWRGREQDKVASRGARRTVDFDAACHVMMQVTTHFLDCFHMGLGGGARWTVDFDAACHVMMQVTIYINRIQKFGSFFIAMTMQCVLC